VEIMKRLFLVLTASIAVLCMSPSAGLCDYHHGGENDSPNFLAVYPDKAGSKVDSCALCHTGGSYKNDSGKTVTLGSCQWCHYKYGINAPHGDVLQTLNSYGTDYLNHGRGKSAISAIEGLDSDGDGYTNLAEILASSYPGDATDNPSKVSAPSRIYTRAQLMALPQHTQFLLMNTTRQVDSYATYTGVPMKDLLDDAGILPGATGIMVFAPDGFSMSHPLEYDASVSTNYHVYGNDPRAPAGQSYQYPPATYYYDPQADVSLNQASGWCDYTSPACAGRSNGDSITVTGGLNAILAIQREGAFLDTGVLNTENTLDGEGPFRVVVPQKNPGPPDQSKTSSVQAVKWPFDGVNGDHNAGACTRSVTIIKVLPLPAGTTDINTMEAGWAYVDSNKIVVYGAIEGSDSNGNGILDSEEHVPGTDYYNDPSSAYPRHAKGTDHVLIHTLKGALANVQVMSDDDPGISQTGKPSLQFPYGAFKFQITGLSAGESVTLAMTFPKAVPSGSHYYKISPSGAWTEVPFTQGSDNKTIMMTLKDGDPATDADGQVNGTILDPGALGTPAESSSSGGGGLCFITMSSHGPWNPHAWMTLSIMLLLLVGSWLRIRSHSSE
jgi:hypothetical protein